MRVSSQPEPRRDLKRLLMRQWIIRETFFGYQQPSTP